MLDNEDLGGYSHKRFLSPGQRQEVLDTLLQKDFDELSPLQMRNLVELGEVHLLKNGSYHTDSLAVERLYVLNVQAINRLRRGETDLDEGRTNGLLDNLTDSIGNVAWCSSQANPSVDRAKECYQHSKSAAESKLKDKPEVAYVNFELAGKCANAVVKSSTDDKEKKKWLAKGARMYEQAIKVARKIGDLDGLADSSLRAAYMLKDHYDLTQRSDRRRARKALTFFRQFSSHFERHGAEARRSQMARVNKLIPELERSL